MTVLRRRLAPLAAMWLILQIGTATIVPLALWASGTDPHQVACTCGHGADMTCPMHHPATGSGPCALQAAHDSGAAILTTLIGLTGLMPDSTVAIKPAAPSRRVRLADAHLLGERPVPPDPPPPRA